MFYTNARIYCPDGTFRLGAFEVKDGVFGAILPNQVPGDAVDLGGATVIPGLVDIHTHGAVGGDLSDADAKGLEDMARYLAQNGITSFAPASMTLPYEVLEKAFACARAFADAPRPGCAKLVGIQMEGPYFSEKKKGAQNGAYLKNPDFEGFSRLFAQCGGLVKIADVAPELPGAEDFIRQASRLCTVSVAHTDSDYDHAKMAFASGATHLTHLYNAMPGIHHRNPGVIPAAVEAEHVTAEIICDGLHVHPASVRLAFSMFGARRMVLVSDSLRCCGLADGQYTLGGQDIFLAGGVAKLADGTLAGSATNLYGCMVKAMEFGIPEGDAVGAATCNPAKVLGCDLGRIQEGYPADFLICRDNYQSKQVFIGGKEI